MLKKVLIIALICVTLLVLTELINLLRLRASVSSYATYWKQVPAAGTFTYVALGDSAAQGIGASKPQLGYVGLLASQLKQATGKTIRIVNLSVSGAKIKDVIAQQLPQLKNYTADLITVEIGSNDVTQYDAQAFQTQYTALAAALPKEAVVSNIPYFGGRIRKNTQAIAANHYISEAAAKYGLKLVDLQSITRERQSWFNYAADLFHPSDRGYRNWDSAFWKIIKPSVK